MRNGQTMLLETVCKDIGYDGDIKQASESAVQRLRPIDGIRFGRFFEIVADRVKFLVAALSLPMRIRFNLRNSLEASQTAAHLYFEKSSATRVHERRRESLRLSGRIGEAVAANSDSIRICRVANLWEFGRLYKQCIKWSLVAILTFDYHHYSVLVEIPAILMRMRRASNETEIILFGTSYYAPLYLSALEHSRQNSVTVFLESAEPRHSAEYRSQRLVLAGPAERDLYRNSVATERVTPAKSVQIINRKNKNYCPADWAVAFYTQGWWMRSITGRSIENSKQLKKALVSDAADKLSSRGSVELERVRWVLVACKALDVEFAWMPHPCERRLNDKDINPLHRVLHDSGASYRVVDADGESCLECATIGITAFGDASTLYDRANRGLRSISFLHAQDDRVPLGMMSEPVRELTDFVADRYSLERVIRTRIRA